MGKSIVNPSGEDTANRPRRLRQTALGSKRSFHFPLWCFVLELSLRLILAGSRFALMAKSFSPS